MTESSNLEHDCRQNARTHCESWRSDLASAQKCEEITRKEPACLEAGCADTFSGHDPNIQQLMCVWLCIYLYIYICIYIYIITIYTHLSLEFSWCLCGTEVCDPEGRTALILAAKSGHLKAMLAMCKEFSSGACHQRGFTTLTHLTAIIQIPHFPFWSILLLPGSITSLHFLKRNFKLRSSAPTHGRLVKSSYQLEQM